MLRDLSARHIVVELIKQHMLGVLLKADEAYIVRVMDATESINGPLPASTLVGRRLRPMTAPPCLR